MTFPYIYVSPGFADFCLPSLSASSGSSGGSSEAFLAASARSVASQGAEGPKDPIVAWATMCEYSFVWGWRRPLRAAGRAP